MKISTSITLLTALAAGFANGAISIHGADLLSSPNATIDTTRTTTVSGNSLVFNSNSSNPQGSGLMSIRDTGTTISVGSIYSLVFDVTRINADTDFGFGISDGSQIWGILAYDLTPGAPALVSGAFTNLDSIPSINFSDTVTSSSIPAVGNSGTIELTFTFEATQTIMNIGGTYYSGLSGNNGIVFPTAYNFGVEPLALMLDGGSGETYQLNSVGVVPEPTGFILLGLGAAVFGSRRRR